MADTLRQRLSTQRAWLLAGAEKTWMAPDIPGKKARSAIAAYAHRVREGDILFLFDETVFGSADRGLILTETHIHVKALFEPPASYAFTTMKKVGAAQSVIMVDGRLIIDLALAQKVTITRLCDLLNAHVASLRQEHCAVEPPAPTPTPQPKDLEPGSIIATQAAPPLVFYFAH